MFCIGNAFGTASIHWKYSILFFDYRRMEFIEPHSIITNCGYSAALKHTLLNHIKVKHNPAGRPKEFQCSLCPLKFYSKSDLAAQIGSHVKENIYKCSECRFETYLKKSFTIHTKTQHGNVADQFSCTFPGCTYITSYKSALKLHGRIHEGNSDLRKPLTSNFPDCNYRTSFQASLASHIRRRHDPNRERKFSCALCPQTFHEKNGLRSHITYLHTKELKYSCEKCSFTTYRKHDLAGHCRRVHGEGPPVEKKFHCDSCDYRTYQQFHLNLHKKTKHSNERSYKCEAPGCHFMTNYDRSFSRHLLSHEDKLEDQFPFACGYRGCDFRRKTETEMKRHEERHEGATSRFKCKFCPNRFYPDSESLFFHKNLSHIRRPYRCEYCDYAVAYKEHLNNHVQVHHAGKSALATATLKPKGTTRYNNRAGFGNASVTAPAPTCIPKARNEYSKLQNLVCQKVPVVAVHRIQLVSV